MSTYTQIIYHIVFSTKNREKTLSFCHHESLFRYIWGILNKKQCTLYQINGTEDHLHILTHLHPNERLADLIKDIKLATNHWNKTENVFPNFRGWQNGYGAFTCSENQKEKLVQYIKRQKEHHKHVDFKEELISLLNEHGVTYDEKYMG
ncbi:IS200/IS605 family transposase [Limibacter armeniacum]|uniref:IS200/IS605 family transposase n=1 Tax=Limibacter armeniacum TaxID=466084 RepID=UPI002FE60DE2